jgi:hypothetical protein
MTNDVPGLGGASTPPPPPPPMAPPGFGSFEPVPVVAQPPKRSKGKLIGAGVAVAALVGGGVFAFTQIRGNDASGGAASPTEVGEALTAAMAAEDALGVVDLLLPGERATFRKPLIDMIDNLKRLEILSSEASLNDVGGLDIEFENIVVTSEPTNVDDIANINVKGDSTVTIDGKGVPIGDLLIDKAFQGERPDMDAAPDDQPVDWNITTVEKDGRWYLSLFYSIAESVREGQDIPDSPIALNGASEPEGAVDRVLQSVSDLDLEGLLGTLNPREAEALQRYAPLFVDDAQQEIDNLGLDWKISDTQFKTKGDGKRRSVEVTGLKFELTMDGDTLEATYDGKCWEIVGTGEQISTCEGEQGIDPLLEEFFADEESAKKLADTVTEAFADYEAPGIVVEQVGGKWFVSPIGSMFDLINGVLAALDKQELSDIIDGIEEVSASLDIDVNDVLDTGDDFSDVPLDDDFTNDALTDCYSNTELDAALTCFSDGVAAGTIDPTLLSAEFRFPECNAAEVYWNGDIFSMSDEEFVAFAEAVSPCFQDKVAEGAIESFWLAPELWAPECLEGKNWYTSSDSDYSSRLFECVGTKQP